MVKKIITFFLLLFFLSPAIAAAIQSEAELNRWYTGYYLSPSPEKVFDGIRYYSSSELFDNNPSRAPFAYFIGLILKENPQLITKTYKQISMWKNDNAKFLFMNALWYVDSDASHSIFKQAEQDWISLDVLRAVEWFSTNPPFDPMAESVQDPEHLNYLWSHYFATGDPQAVRGIVGALSLFDRDDPISQSTAEMILESLKSLALTHPAVLEVCQEEQARQTGIVKEKLSEVVIIDNQK